MIPATAIAHARALWIRGGRIKPDVVFEAGNVVTNARGEIDFPCPDLSLLSTHYQPGQKSFVLSWATSAATAQVARMAALITSVYPTLWPEAVRGLIAAAGLESVTTWPDLAGIARVSGGKLE